MNHLAFGPLGIEPSLPAPKAGVLPVYYGPPASRLMRGNPARTEHTMENYRMTFSQYSTLAFLRLKSKKTQAMSMRHSTVSATFFSSR